MISTLMVCGKRGSGVLSPLRYESGKPMTGLAAGCRRKVTVVEPLTPPDRITPMAPAEIRFASKLKAHVGEAGARCEAFRLTATPINVTPPR